MAHDQSFEREWWLLSEQQNQRCGGKRNDDKEIGTEEASFLRFDPNRHLDLEESRVGGSKGRQSLQPKKQKEAPWQGPGGSVEET